jgi:hypothetical protein
MFLDRIIKSTRTCAGLASTLLPTILGGAVILIFQEGGKECVLVNYIAIKLFEVKGYLALGADSVTHRTAFCYVRVIQALV